MTAPPARPTRPTGQQQPSQQPGQEAPGSGQIAVDANAVIAALQAQISDHALALAVMRVRAETAETNAAHLAGRVRDLEAGSGSA